MAEEEGGEKQNRKSQAKKVFQERWGADRSII